jgi:hypothetical protein
MRRKKKKATWKLGSRPWYTLFYINKSQHPNTRWWCNFSLASLDGPGVCLHYQVKSKHCTCFHTTAFLHLNNQPLNPPPPSHQKLYYQAAFTPSYKRPAFLKNSTVASHASGSDGSLQMIKSALVHVSHRYREDFCLNCFPGQCNSRTE